MQAAALLELRWLAGRIDRASACMQGRPPPFHTGPTVDPSAEATAAACVRARINVPAVQLGAGRLVHAGSPRACLREDASCCCLGSFGQARDVPASSVPKGALTAANQNSYPRIRNGCPHQRACPTRGAAVGDVRVRPRPTPLPAPLTALAPHRQAHGQAGSDAPAPSLVGWTLPTRSPAATTTPRSPRRRRTPTHKWQGDAGSPTGTRTTSVQRRGVAFQEPTATANAAGSTRSANAARGRADGAHHGVDH